MAPQGAIKLSPHRSRYVPDHASAIPVPELMSHGKRPPLPALTSIRFFAALYVVLFHCHQQDRLAPLFASGYTGVTLFFALSGFILAYNYPLVKDRAGFWVSRFARIYPVYALSILLCILQLSHLPGPRFQGQLWPILAVFALLQSWWPAWGFTLNTVAWTLSVEALFYAVFPFVINRASRLTRLHFAFFTLLYLALVVFPIALSFSPAHAGLALLLAHLLDGTIPLFRLGTFLIGVAAGVSFTHLTRSGQKPPRSLLWISALTTLLLLAWLPGDIFRPLKTMLLAFSYSGLVFALATVQWRWLVNRWLLLAGEISYSIYLFQILVFHVANDVSQRLFGRQFPLDIYIPFLILFAYAGFRFVEVPARDLIRNAWRRHTQHA
jgi:peptidoglycan/LPS O-acetylase OafA/YrhL